jgi:hypothetical protein
MAAWAIIYTMTFDNHGMASTPAVTISGESPEKVELLAGFELEACTVNNWLRAVMHRHRYASLHRAIVITWTGKEKKLIRRLSSSRLR